MWPASTRLVDAMQRWPGSEEPGQTGWALAEGTETPMFEVVGREGERARRMAGAMRWMHQGSGYGAGHVVEGFAWGEAAEGGMLVDVGGGTGGVAVEIARMLPRVRCVVQDLPDVVAGAEVPEDLGEGRVRFMQHDFFEEQPVRGADVYLLRWVLHDWSDKYAVRILRNLVPALKRGARVLAVDLCLPPPGALSPYRERSVR